MYRPVDPEGVKSSTTNPVDAVWLMMKNAELYSLADLRSVSRQTTDELVPVLEFLTRYGFAERVTRREWLLRRLNVPGAPRGTAAVLQAILASSLSHSAARSHRADEECHRRSKRIPWTIRPSVLD